LKASEINTKSYFSIASAVMLRKTRNRCPIVQNAVAKCSISQ
jgi:hypothetical protein